MFPISITSDHVHLREVRDDDIEQVLALVGDERVTTWLSFDTRDRQAATDMLRGIIARSRAEPRTEFYLAVTRTGDDTMIGFVRLGLTGHHAAKLGYSIRADEWGKGYATAAAAAMLDFAFTTLKLHRVTAAIGPTNVASIHVVERLGFRHEGRLRDHVHTNGAWRDSELYSILTSEWAARRAHQSALGEAS
jgi:RimJ/RimL family protein N-acetyltransferase